jgi:pSer/pThr/pTyr-binding forkhead associated (FHA) protein/predicted RNA-binding Zn-ribbon protein involved in translation (DUF1610 family)
MSEIKIKCPTCGKVLCLNETPTINKATFMCPNCKEKHIVGNCQRYTPAPPKPAAPSAEETRYAGYKSGTLSGDETLVGAPPQPKVGMLVDSNGAAYQLAIGFNTIGRKASSSTAFVQIPTDDRTMSRNHAVIEVRNAGGQLLHILKNGANKNPSYHNNMLVGPGDQLILNNGDRLKMGNTVLTFKK